MAATGNKMRRADNGGMLFLVGLKPSPPIFGSTGADVQETLKDIVAVAEDDQFDVIDVVKAVYSQLVQQVVDVDEKPNWDLEETIRNRHQMGALLVQ